MHRGFRWEIQKERDHLEDLDVGERIILKFILDRDRLYDLLVRVPGYRSRGTGFDSRRF
jgi:hypothetical protein